MIKVLYLQHAGSLGGSSMSLLWTIDALDRTTYDPTVALIRLNPSVSALYHDHGIDTIAWPGIYTFEHTTASWYSLTSPITWSAAYFSITGWGKSQRRTEELIEMVRPDLVHLNSVVLVPSALALSKNNVPFIWHVRESTVRGCLGVRTRYLKHLLITLPSEVIFISKYDKQSWVSSKRGVVIPNFVDFAVFDRQRKGEVVRSQLGIEKDTHVFLYLGGLGEIKGIFPLLEALARVHAQRTDWICIMPGSQYLPSNRLSSRIARSVLPVLGSGTIAQRVQRKLAKLGIEDKLMFLPYTTDIVPYFAACDMLLFPATRPHFARPVIEAASMGKPSIGSNLGGVSELIVHNQTGLLVEPESASALANAILTLMDDEALAQQLGGNAYRMARERFDAKRNVLRIEQIYDAVLATPRGSK